MGHPAFVTDSVKTSSVSISGSGQHVDGLALGQLAFGLGAVGFFAVRPAGVFAVAGNAESGCGLASGPRRRRRTKGSLYALLRFVGSLAVLRVKHGDDGGGATAVTTGPLAVDQRALYGLPMLGVGFQIAVELGKFAGVVVIVQGIEKLHELLEICAHLKDQLAQRH